MQPKKKLDRRRFRAKDDEGNPVSEITATSIVKDPAIERSFQYFNAVKPQVQEFKVSNEEKMEITGPAMIPDLDIKRIDEETKEEYYCYFTKQDVEDFAELYLSKDYHLKANFDHKEYFTDDIRVKESWVCVDPEMDKSKALGFDNQGATPWYITYKVLNKDLWKRLKMSDLSGFSVELSIGKNAFEEAKLEAKLSAILDSEMDDEQKRQAIREIAA